MEHHAPSFRLVDAHCHLDLFPSPDLIIKEIEDGSICTIAVTNAPFLFANTQALAKRSPLIFPALGLHPELVSTHGDQLEQFHQLLPSTRFVGEIGLDYVTKDETNRAEQRRIFASIVEACANVGNKVLTIHTRRSAPDVLDILGERFPGTVILHWYSGALRDLRRAIDAGFYFSVNTAMVRSEQGQRIIREIPLDRLLTETDGPFAKHEGEPATPAAIPCVLDGLATLWDRTADEIRHSVCCNSNVALGLPSERNQG